MIPINLFFSTLSISLYFSVCMQFNRLLLILALGWMVAGCSVKKNTWVSRNYHTLTSYYNVYYNGREAFREGERAIVSQSPDDYTGLLPVFQASVSAHAQVAKSQMEVAAAKGKKLIQEHSITAKPARKPGSRNTSLRKQREYNPLVDDAWLLIGKSAVVVHEYEQAMPVLEYLVREFEDSPVRFEAYLWLARAYTQQNQWINAAAALESYDLTGIPPESLYGLYQATAAQLKIARQEWLPALGHMQKAVQHTTDRVAALRYAFIAGQLAQLCGKGKEAQKAFLIAAQRNPSYEMSFNALLSLAAVVSEEGNTDETEKKLHKLRRDRKNAAYLDQIYYALGQLKSNRGATSEAMQYFRKSIQSSEENLQQKGISYVAQGDFYFQSTAFPNALAAYDSAQILLSEANPRYPKLTELTGQLKQLVPHEKAIQLQDSLLRLAGMSEAERTDVIEALHYRMTLDQEAAARKLSGAIVDPFSNTGNSSSYMLTQQGGKWYFYNTSSVAAGKVDFERRWGKRKNEDHWRRSQKSSSLSEENLYEEPGMNSPPEGRPVAPVSTPGGQPSEKEAASGGNSSAVPSKEQMLANVPLTAQAIQKSNTLLAQSLFAAAGILSDQMNLYRPAIERYEQLLDRYPLYPERLDALMGLYEAYRKLPDPIAAQGVADRIVRDFSESKFARFLSDPEFNQKRLAEERQVESGYAQTYEHYLLQEYGKVVELAERVDSGNVYHPKYLLLGALSHARLGDGTQFQTQLQQLIAYYPTGEEAEKAKTWLSEMEKGRQPVRAVAYLSPLQKAGQQAIGAAAASEAGQFIYAPSDLHTLVLIPDSAAHLELLQYYVADYNFGRYLLADYEVQIESMPDRSRLVLVKGLRNKTEAMDYLYGLREQNDLFEKASAGNCKLEVASEFNLKILLSSGDQAGYDQFFQENYLQQRVEPAASRDLPPSANPKVEPTPPFRKADHPVMEPTQNTEAVPSDAIAKKTEQPKTEPLVQAGEATPEATTPEATLKPDEGPFVVALFVRKGRVDLRRIQGMVTNFSLAEFGERLSGEISDMGSTYRVIRIEGFHDQADAQFYLSKLKQNEYLMRNFTGSGHFLWVMSVTAFEQVLKEGDPAKYDSAIQKSASDAGGN